LPTDILISSDPWENRVAILEDGRLAEIYVEREERVIGSIYKGKVVNVLPGMGASFVDIGLGRNAFLYVDDINKTPLNIGDVEVTSGRSGYTITEKVSRGDDVLVQIVKEPRGLKGARVSTNISLPGRYLILMPTGKFSGVSRKIESDQERVRLRKLIQSIVREEDVPSGGFIVRTAGVGISEQDLRDDARYLVRTWRDIRRNAERMRDLINDILELSAIEAGTVTVEARDVRLSSLVGDCFTALASRAEERRVSLRNEVGADVLVRADARRLEQMLTNLVDNAVKFNREGGEVVVTHERNAGRDRVTVTDTGEGIAPEHLPRIFERFYRVDRARSRAMGGTGLGLAIVKHLARAHGGEAAVRSTPGEGSTFWFRLPPEIPGAE